MSAKMVGGIVFLAIALGLPLIAWALKLRSDRNSSLSGNDNLDLDCSGSKKNYVIVNHGLDNKNNIVSVSKNEKIVEQISTGDKGKDKTNKLQ